MGRNVKSKKHQERTQRASQKAAEHFDPTGTMGMTQALWQIAQSLAAIADSLEPEVRVAALRDTAPALGLTEEGQR